MASDVQEIRRKRFDYLQRLYEITDASENETVNCFEFGNQLGFLNPEIDKITDFLEGEGLIEYAGLGGEISITHKGIVEVEKALLKPDEPTTYFPPVNYIHVEQMIGSQIQQGTNQSSQVLTYTTNDIEAVAKFVLDMKSKLSELELSKDTQAEVEADLETIDSQIKSPRPKPSIIKDCLISLQTVLEGIAGNVIAALLMQQIGTLLK